MAQSPGFPITRSSINSSGNSFLQRAFMQVFINPPLRVVFRWPDPGNDDLECFGFWTSQAVLDAVPVDSWVFLASLPLLSINDDASGIGVKFASLNLRANRFDSITSHVCPKRTRARVIVSKLSM